MVFVYHLYNVIHACDVDGVDVFVCLTTTTKKNKLMYMWNGKIKGGRVEKSFVFVRKNNL